MTKKSKQSRPGGRTDRNRKAVAHAVLGLIESGRADFELQDVAKLSGVHRTTIYRRWPKREDLLTEALVFNADKLTIPEERDWRKYLHKLAFVLRSFLATPAIVAIGSLMASPATPREFADHVMNQWGFVIDRLVAPLLVAQAKGQFRKEADPFMLINLLLSYIVSFTILSKEPPSVSVVENAVRNLIILGEVEKGRTTKK